MPTVAPRYGTRKIASDPLPGVRRQAAETNLSTGVGIEQAKIDKAQAISQVGSEIGRMGQQFAQIAIEERQKAILASSFESDNKLSRLKADLLYGPQDKPNTGALSRQGQDARPLPEEIGAAFEKGADEIAATIKTKEGRALFAKQRANHGTDLDLIVRRHTDAEIQASNQKELQGVVVNGTNDAIALALTPELVDKKLAEIVSAVQVGAPKLLGMGPEEVKTKVAEVTTGVHVGVLNRLIAEGKDQEAATYFTKNAEAMTVGDERAKMKAKLASASAEGAGFRASGDLWGKYGPQGDDDPIAIDKMQAAAREQFKDNPKAFESTMFFLREQKAAVDASRIDRSQQRAGNLWKQVADNTPLAEIMRSKAYLSADEGTQAKIKRGAIELAESRADRSYILGQRGVAEADRLDRTQEKAWSAMMWKYTQPEILSKLSEDDITAMLPNIGVSNMNRLMVRKRELTQSELAVRAGTMDMNDFKAVADRAGLPGTKTVAQGLTEEEAQGLNDLHSKVETAIATELQGTNKKDLPRERKAQIMQGIVDQKVMLDRWGGLTSESATAAMVVNAKDRAKAYVPAATIEAADAKSAARGGPKFIDDSINKILSKAESSALYKGRSAAEQRILFMPRVQRAYALMLMGEPDAAIDRVLYDEPEP